ncbi:MAG: UDP-N-acetylmuramoyl-L-alanyl-D-glutamate--2,6-diaminopimelate ligase [Desulfobacterales bacterium]
MRLSPLIARLAPLAVSGLSGEGPEIGSLHCRAQETLPGGLFVAVRGTATDGHRFIPEALARGAAAVVAEEALSLPVPLVRVADARRALAELAAAFYGDPARELTLVAVTGTNGKTTTSYLLESILRGAGCEVGVIGTVNIRWTGKILESPVTTPESLDLQRTLRLMREDGVTHVVLEASSHAIELARIHACPLDVAVFTNLSQDHLDFHGDMARYGAAKRRLFSEYLARGPKAERALAVINTDHAFGRRLADTLPRVLRVGTGADCDVRGELLGCDLAGLRGRIRFPDGEIAIASRLVGRHNFENILCAAGAARALNLPHPAVAAGVAALACVPGRLEEVAPGDPRRVFVDYAHTPDALEHALATLSGLKGGGRLLCVFGCGGDRDRAKRPLMGEIAGRLSDFAILTSDNPRSEPPEAILEEIAPGLAAAGALEVNPADVDAAELPRGFVREPDRRCAIALAVRLARPGDIVLIAGKGHEPYQIVGGERRRFDDREEAAAALAAPEGGRPWRARA